MGYADRYAVFYRILESCREPVIYTHISIWKGQNPVVLKKRIEYLVQCGLLAKKPTTSLFNNQDCIAYCCTPKGLEFISLVKQLNEISNNMVLQLKTMEVAA